MKYLENFDSNNKEYKEWEELTLLEMQRFSNDYPDVTFVKSQIDELVDFLKTNNLHNIKFFGHSYLARWGQIRDAEELIDGCYSISFNYQQMDDFSYFNEAEDHFSIQKSIDDWFTVFYNKLSNKKTDIKRYDTFYYKCDGIDGVKSCILHLISKI